MAVNESRSMNVELRLGELDGSVKVYRPNTGGEIEPTTRDARQGLASYYDFADGRNVVALPVPDFMKIRI